MLISCISQTHLLLDEEHHVAGILHGQPRQGWQPVHNESFKALNKAVQFLNQTPAEPHLRGEFHSIAHGISFGGGQQEAGPLCQSEAAYNELNSLMENNTIQRMCNHASGKHTL
jgi:hypothetical protein